MVDKVVRSSSFMMEKNIQTMIEKTHEFNVPVIYKALKYNYRTQNYLVAQGKGADFRFFAIGAKKNNEDAMVFSNRMSKETLVLI